MLNGDKTALPGEPEARLRKMARSHDPTSGSLWLNIRRLGSTYYRVIPVTRLPSWGLEWCRSLSKGLPHKAIALSLSIQD
nr:MAG: hypothetical protein H1Rhizo273170_000003 [Mitovirus sp.]